MDLSPADVPDTPGSSGTEYPAAPWDLHGHCVVGLFLVSPEATPTPPVPAGTRAVTVFGRRIVGVAYFVYEEPSPLTYDEVMATVLVRRGPRPFVSIPRIWVDSPASRAGGRELWAIPKELARFRTTPLASYDAEDIGALRIPGPPRRFTPPLPVAFRILQLRSGAGVRTPVRGRVRVALAGGRWDFAADGPLRTLAGRRPLLTIAVRPFRLRFGE